MKFTQFENKHFIRIDKGEEIVDILTKFCNSRSITLGKISAIGAVNEVEIGIFEPTTKEYNSNMIKGTFEILSISGNISCKKNKPYLHMHIILSDSDYKAFGGHLNRAVVSATCEVIIEEYEGTLERYFDDNVGLNLFGL